MSDTEKQTEAHSATKDLQHFLNLAHAQLKHRLKQAESTEPYSEGINRMRLLEELIKEQVPQHGNQTNPVSAASKTR